MKTGTQLTEKMPSLDQLLDEMWSDYCALNPQAAKIHQLFLKEGETVLNDHIALRTFNHPKLGIRSLAKVFEKFGYTAKGEYYFPEKRLYAQHFEHPNLDYPKVFISELELQKVSPFIRDTLNALAEKIPATLLESDRLSYCGRPWEMDFTTYEKLATESEYASWVAAFGFRPNHFTVNTNALKKYTDLTKLNTFIKSHGYKLNSSGGEIKGTPEVLLEQSSTMAEEIEVAFTDGKHRIPSCYYEFARRYKMPDGKYYQGFVAQSADKIFESTNRSK